jgi:ParB family chromosome partitioning protein
MKNTEQFQHLPIEKLQRGKYQPRREFKPEALQELADSIRMQGIVQPIVVRMIAQGQYEIIAGERRWRAAQAIGLKNVPCVITDYDDERAAAITLIENIQREDLNPIEEASSYQRLLQEFSYTHERLANELGKNRPVITNRLRLLTLDIRVQEQLKDGKLSEGHCRALAGLATEQQYPLAKRCEDKGWSVRKLEQVLKKGVSATPVRGDDIHQRRYERHLSEQLGTEVVIERGEEGSDGSSNL